ncbi:hypothetical protein TRIP_E230092 [uncultured Spirochaetota bacterium]|nr:hypothetical protein TRIP_E230092 [uncultured Spirochaetota bacterium]
MARNSHHVELKTQSLFNKYVDTQKLQSSRCKFRWDKILILSNGNWFYMGTYKVFFKSVLTHFQSSSIYIIRMYASADTDD